MVVFFLFLGCQKKENVKVGNDTIVIKKKCVVFYEPTEKQINKNNSEFAEDDPRRESTDDVLYYLSECRVFMEGQNVEILTVENDKILEFVISEKKSKVVQIESKKEIDLMWKIYLFEPGKEPVELEDITSPETEYRQYFKN